MVICLERGADLHMAQLMPLPLTVSCFSKIQIGFAFLVLAHPGSLGKRAIKWACVCVLVDGLEAIHFQMPSRDLLLLSYEHMFEVSCKNVLYKSTVIIIIIVITTHEIENT